MEYKGLMGGFYKITEWIMRISGSNLLWMICSLPFMFFLMTWLLSPDAIVRDQTLLFMAVLAPFTLFPATAALFSVARKWVMGESDLSVFKVYFKGYKENYKQSMFGGIFYTLLIVIMVVDYNVYMKQFENLQIIGMIMLVFLLILSVSLFNFFSLVSHYHLKVILLIKNSILLTIISPLRVIYTVITTIALALITVKFPWLIMFGFGSLTAYIAFYNFYRAYTKLQAKAEKMQENDGGIDNPEQVEDGNMSLQLPGENDSKK
ncbi:putative membrane protein YesL [Paenibacillus anaericanus]|uniref:YesL family protein n=1 Tax=Paenibacillus anaericanus TaxID=170367 RepID=UPI0027897A2D|nr:DUF624 domain-containing protein [Paenibacillus anaericanus]MDQ0086780.1 putative membrane protein YesL [Paenibacillus anaericanus]